jgi:aspartate oxidase
VPAVPRKPGESGAGSFRRHRGRRRRVGAGRRDRGARSRRQCRAARKKRQARRLGGSTAWSIGSITATGTPHQLKNRIADNPDDHFADMPLFAGELASRDNEALRRILCDEVPETFRWLMSLGVRFCGPMPEPPHRKPRLHNVLPNSLSYIYHLGRHAQRVGVDVRKGVHVTALSVDESRVPGVACGDGRNILARLLREWRRRAREIAPCARAAHRADGRLCRPA